MVVLGQTLLKMLYGKYVKQIPNDNQLVDFSQNQFVNDILKKIF